MKVTLVNKGYPPKVGGIEYHVRQLATQLCTSSEVEKLHILVANDRNQFQKETINEKTDIVRLPTLITIQSTPIAPTFPRWFNIVDSDIFHHHFPYPFGDFAWMISRNKKPYVITYHSDIIRQRILGKIYRPLMTMFLDGAAKILVTSSQIAESSSTLREYRKKIEVVPLGIDPIPFVNTENAQQLATQIRSNYGNRPLILFIGRLVYYKGVDILIKAVEKLDATLLIIGDGPLEQNLRLLARDLRIETKVHFISSVSDKLLPAYYHACDVFTLPSVENTEAYGLVQLEAHACGKPVVSTNLRTGVPFVNEHNVTGLVVPPSNVEALSKALQELLENTQLRLKLGANAKSRLNLRFTSKIMAEHIIKIYKSVIM